MEQLSIEVITPYLINPIVGIIKKETTTHLTIQDEAGIIYEVRKDSNLEREEK